MEDDPVQRFLSLIQADPTLQRELGITSNDAKKPKLTLQRFVELGERYGCRFTVEQLRTRQSASWQSLSDEELEHVAGGTARSAFDPLGGYSFKIEIDGISFHRGAGYNELSLDDTAGKEK